MKPNVKISHCWRGGREGKFYKNKSESEILYYITQNGIKMNREKRT